MCWDYVHGALGDLPRTTPFTIKDRFLHENLISPLRLLKRKIKQTKMQCTKRPLGFGSRKRCGVFLRLIWGSSPAALGEGVQSVVKPKGWASWKRPFRLWVRFLAKSRYRLPGAEGLEGCTAGHAHRQQLLPSPARRAAWKW